MLSAWLHKASMRGNFEAVSGLLFFLFTFNAFLSFSQSDCDLKRDKDGIKVYTCKSDSSNFRSLVAEFDLKNTSLKTLEDFLWDVDNYVNWQYNMLEASLIKEITDNDMIYRSEIDAPWPVENRELLVKFSVIRNPVPDEVMFLINSIAYDYQVRENVVRVPYSSASWQVKKDGNSLHIKYMMNIDPGGYVPSWLVNLAMAEGPYVSFRNLKKMIEKK
jgi:START domain